MLTPQQIQEARNKIGTNKLPGDATGQSLLARLRGEEETVKQDIKSDFLGIGKDILAGSQERAENIQEIRGKKEAGTKGDVAATLETAGQLAGAGADAIGSAFKGAVKLVLPPKAEAKTKELATKLGQKVVARPEVQSVIKLYDALPEDKKDALDAVGGVASLVSEFIGVGAGQKVAKQSVKTAKQGAKAVSNTVGDVATATKKVTGEIIPSKDRVVNYQVTKALDLTAGDVKNINLSTGNETGEFIARNNLIKGNKDETTEAIKVFTDTDYKTVRDEVSKVTKLYKAASVPRYTESLKEIKKVIGDTPGLQEVGTEVDNLLSKVKTGNITLNDVQRTKELMDEHFSLYKVTGDVKESVSKQGLANLRGELKNFIEKEVREATGADISVMNNNVATGKSILNAIEERSTRGLTSSNIKMGDLGVFGLGSAIGTPILGLGAVIAKKIVESSAIRLKIAKYLDKISDAKKLKLQEKLIKGEMPQEIIEIVEPQSSLSPKIQTKAKAK